jgi:hypothetical protein
MKKLLFITLLLPIATCMSSCVTEQSGPTKMSIKPFKEQSQCNQFADRLVAPLLSYDLSSSSMVEIERALESRPGLLLSKIMNDTVTYMNTHIREDRWKDESLSYFAAFDSVSDRSIGLPHFSCGPVFHELVAEKLFLGVGGGAAARASRELNGLGISDLRDQERHLLLGILVIWRQQSGKQDGGFNPEAGSGSGLPSSEGAWGRIYHRSIGVDKFIRWLDQSGWNFPMRCTT